jgi:uncharacterized alkaline shock family protein YloU
LGIIDRLVLTIYTLLLAIVSGMMVVVAIAPDWMQPHVWFAEAMTTPRGRWAVGVIGAVFFAVSVRLIAVAFRRRGGGQPVIHETAMGEVRISLDAVENLVRKTARSIKGVREIKAIVSHTKDGLHIFLMGTISPEVSIPEVSEEIQSQVRTYVKRVVGVEPIDIRLQVENIANEGRRARLD